MPDLMNLDSTDILILDDDKLVLRSLELSLEELGSDLRVHQAQTAEIATKRIESNSYHLIFVDLRLKQNLTGGLDWIEEIAPKHKDTPFILYTSYQCDPEIRKVIAKRSERYQNFLIFFEEKEGHNHLKELVSVYLGLPPKFIALVERLKQNLERSQSRLAYEEGKTYVEAKNELEELRQEISTQIKELKKSNPESMYLKRLEKQYEQIKGDWLAVLTRYMSQSPGPTTIWLRIRYYEFLTHHHLTGEMNKVNVSSFRSLLKIFNYFRPIENESKEKKQKKEEQQKTEEKYFVGLIQATSEEEAKQTIHRNRFDNYLKLRRELWEKGQDLPPEILFELTSPSYRLEQNQLLPKLLERWEDSGSIKELQKAMTHRSSRRVNPEQTERVQTALFPVVNSATDSSVKPMEWIEKKGYYYGQDEGMNGVEALTVHFSCAIYDAEIPYSIIGSWLKGLSQKSHRIQVDSMPRLAEEKFENALKTLLLFRKDSIVNFAQSNVLFLGCSPFIALCFKVGEKWLTENPSGYEPDTLDYEFLELWQGLSANKSLFLVNLIS